MPDDFGRVNPVSPHFLDRDARGEPYQGRHPRKHQDQPQDQDQDSTDVYLDETMEEGAEAAGASTHIDLRI